MNQQQTMILSPYIKIYDLIIPQDNFLRKINELVDFSFVYNELQDKYCLDNGSNTISPICMFKYLMLKAIYKVSDVDIVERSKTDMSFKYFLDMAHEEEVIEASSLTKFRKLRLKDFDLLDLLINKTVGIAVEKGIIKSKSIIVDSPNTRARYNQKTPREVLLEYSENLRESVYKVDKSLKEILPPKVNKGVLEDAIEYCEELIVTINKHEVLSAYPHVKEKMNLLEETIIEYLEKIALSKDEDAKVGHKKYDTSFFGHKIHIAMTEERIITGVTVTSGLIVMELQGAVNIFVVNLKRIIG